MRKQIDLWWRPRDEELIYGIVHVALIMYRKYCKNWLHRFILENVEKFYRFYFSQIFSLQYIQEDDLV